MTYSFKEIESEFADSQIVVIASDPDNKAISVVKLDKDDLAPKYYKQFRAQKMVALGDRFSPPEYKDAGYDITLKEWYDEYLRGNEKTAWELWNKFHNKAELITA